jgi:hypothetical protein
MFDGVAFNEEHWVLSVRFKTGLVLHYQKIPPELYEELLAAESVGKFYNSAIKGKFEHLREEAPAKPLLVADKPVDAAADLSQAREPVVFKPRSEGITDMAVKEGDTCAAPNNSPVQETSQFHAENEPNTVDSDCYVHMGITPHWRRSDGSLVCSLCHPPQVHVSEVAHYDADAIERELNDQRRLEESRNGLTKTPVAMPALEPPKTPAEAITLLNEQEGLIQATIKQNNEIAKEAMTLKVSDAASYTTAGERLKLLTEVKDRAFKFLDPIRQILLKPYQLAQLRLKESTDPIDTALGHVKRQRTTWADAQEAIRLAEQQRRTREEAERAEVERVERGTQLTLGAVEDALANGDETTAEKLIAEPISAAPVYIPPVHVESVVPQQSGISKRKNWKCELVNFEDLILDIAQGICSTRDNRGLAGHAPTTFLKWNETATNQAAKSQEAAMSYPGLKSYNDATENVRRKK